MISGPSGAGKGTLVTRVRERRSNLGLTVSATTRAPRKGEVDGVNYFFLTREEFDRRVANGEFVEWAEVHGNCYGTLVSEVTRIKCELDRDHGSYKYEIEFSVGRMEYEYEIDAYTGAILKAEHDYDD